MVVGQEYPALLRHAQISEKSDVRAPSPSTKKKVHQADDFRSPGDEPRRTASAKLEKTSSILSSSQRMLLSQALPLALQQADWKRLYSLGTHGASFATLVDKVKEYRYTVIVIQTNQNRIFGGFATHTWKAHRGFYGDGQSFLFSFENVQPSANVKSDKDSDSSNQSTVVEFLFHHLLNACAVEVCFSECNVAGSSNSGTGDSESGGGLKIYNWTGLNRYFQHCSVSDQRIAFGGGNDNFGLCLETDFVQGTSEYCETFGNQALGGEPTFMIQNVEVYGISSACF